MYAYTRTIPATVTPKKTRKAIGPPSHAHSERKVTETKKFAAQFAKVASACAGARAQRVDLGVDAPRDGREPEPKGEQVPLDAEHREDVARAPARVELDPEAGREHEQRERGALRGREQCRPLAARVWQRERDGERDAQ